MIKQKLLLVDDEDRILRSLRMVFYENYDVSHTTDPNEALRILRDERVHVIICDQRMPLMNGSELLRRACEISPATMRILLTGYSDLDASIASVNEGEVFRYLLKPWDTDEITHAVAEAAALSEACFSVLSHSTVKTELTNSPPRVLIIDHDSTTAEVVHETLGDRCSIIWASDAKHAMDELARKDVSIVVSEILLGDTNVSYILKTIKQLNPHTQCIVVTSFNDTAHLIELINQAQISRFLLKPFSKNMFVRHLEFLLKRFTMARNQGGRLVEFCPDWPV
jgi:serine/threonine-protein kinase